MTEIRVVDYARRLGDLQGLAPGELDTYLQDLADRLGLQGGPRLQLLGLAQLAAQKRAARPPLPDAPPLISLRQLLYDPRVLPIVARLGRPKAGDAIRPGVRKEIWLAAPPAALRGSPAGDHAAAAAAEDSLELVGLAVLKSGGAAEAAWAELGRPMQKAWPKFVRAGRPGAAIAITLEEADDLSRALLAEKEIAGQLDAAVTAPRSQAARALPAARPPAAPGRSPALDLARELSEAAGWAPPQSENGALQMLVQVGALQELAELGAGRPDAGRDLADAMKARRQEQLAAAGLASQLAADAARAAQLSVLAAAKFGIGAALSLALVERGAAAAADPDEVLAALAKLKGAAAAKLVAAEHEGRLKNWAAEAANSCAHKMQLRQLRDAADEDRERLVLARLKKFLAPAKGAGLRECQRCGFAVICPHELTTYELRLAHAPYAELEKGLRPYRSEGSGAATEVFCKLCGGRLLGGVAGPDAAKILGRVGEIEDDLRSALWGDALRLAGGAKPFLKFSSPIDPRNFASELIGVAFPLAAGDLGGRRRRAALGPRHERLVGKIYLYAQVLNLVLSARAKDAPRGRVLISLEGVRDGVPPSDLARALLAHLVSNSSQQTGGLEGVTKEKIANQFREAYKQILNTSGHQALIAFTGPELYLIEATTHPMYSALALGGRLAGRLPLGTTKQQKDPAGAVAREFEFVLGETLAQAASWKPPAKYGPFVRAVLAASSGGGRSFSYPSGSDPNWVARTPEIGMFGLSGLARGGAPSGAPTISDLFAGGAAGTPTVSDLFAGRATGGKKESKSKGSKENKIKKSKGKSLPGAPVPPEARPNSYRGALPALKVLRHYAAVRDAAGWAAHKKVRADAIKSAEPDLLMRLLATTPTRLALVHSAGRAYKNPPAALGRVYDLQGRRHEWQTGEPPIKCRACGLDWAQAEALDPVKVESAVRARSQAATMIAFFSRRCPEGTVHEGLPCAKCGRPETFEEGSPAAFAYFEKYSDAWRGLASRPLPALPRAAAPPAPDAAPFLKVAQEFGGRAVELAALLTAHGRNTRAEEFYNLGGGSEGRPEGELMVPPPPPVGFLDPRLAAADGAVRQLLTGLSRAGGAPKLPADFGWARRALAATGPGELLAYFQSVFAGLALAADVRAATQVVAKILDAESRLALAGEFRRGLLHEEMDVDVELEFKTDIGFSEPEGAKQTPYVALDMDVDRSLLAANL